LEAVVHNLEGDKAGSKYPLVMRINKEETPGWYIDEMGRLREELEDIKSRLSAVPVNRSTLMYEAEEDVTRHVQEFKKRHPSRTVNSLGDLYSYFVDTWLAMVSRALETGQGLAATY
jgi:hypothetical protein